MDDELVKPAQNILKKDSPFFAIKSFDDEEGIIEMYVSIFGNVDSANEIIEYGAFSESLEKKFPKGLWNHDWGKPVAKTLEAVEIPARDERLPEKIFELGGLLIKAKFNLKTTRGHDAYWDVKEGVFDEFSIGYLPDPKHRHRRKDGVTVLKKVRLFEWSVVLAGANSETMVVSVKSADLQDNIAIEKKQDDLSVQIKSALYGNIENASVSSAIEEIEWRRKWALWDAIYSDGTTDEKMQTIQEILSEADYYVMMIAEVLLRAFEDDTELQKHMGEEFEQKRAGMAEDVGEKSGRRNNSADEKLLHSMKDALGGVIADIETLIGSEVEERQDEEEESEGEESKKEELKKLTIKKNSELLKFL